MTNDINIYEPIHVQYGTLKQKLYPYETLADISYVTNLGVCADDCVRIDLSECSDDCAQVGLTVERLRREVKFGIPHSATAFRKGVPLSNDDQVLPGNVIEFVRRRASKKIRSELQQKTASDAASATIEDEVHDNSKLVVSRKNFSVQYKGRTCVLGNLRPFALIERLNHSPGICISLQELRDAICGVNSRVADETIQKHASDLRKKLRKAEMDGIVIDGKQKGYYTLRLT